MIKKNIDETIKGNINKTKLTKTRISNIQINKNRLIKIIIIASILILIFSYINTTKASDLSVYVWANSSEELTVETNASIDETKIEELEKEEDSNILDIESESCILIDMQTGEILYEKNMHEQLRPASVTKVMSILLIMEAIREW